MTMNNQLPKSIIVAGAHGDVGKVVCRTLSQKGYDVIGLARSLNTELECLSRYFSVDLSEKDKLEPIIKGCINNSNLAGIVNCAGAYQATGTDGAVDDIFRQNYHLAENLLAAVCQFADHDQPLRCITLGSIDATFPNPNSFSYSVAKAAINSLIKLYKKKYRETAINFDLIEPGAINTRMRANKDEDKSLLIQPEDIASVIEMLFSVGDNCTFDTLVMYPKHFVYSN